MYSSLRVLLNIDVRRVGRKVQEYKWAKYHKQTLSKTSRNLSVIELSNTCPLIVSQVKPNLLPRLSHGGVQRTLVAFLRAPSRKGNMAVCALAVSAFSAYIK